MYNTIKVKYLQWKARHKLLSQYEYVTEVNKIMEDYFTEKLLSGGSADFMKRGRESLLEAQAEIKKNTEFIRFLKEHK